MQNKPVAVLGAGSWGTALALVLAHAGREVRLISNSEAQVLDIVQHRQNRDFLPGVLLPDNIAASVGADALRDAEALIVAVPCASLEGALAPIADYSGPVVVASKGLHPDSLKRSDEIVSDVMKSSEVAILSGPSFAIEVAQHKPTAITLAAETYDQAARLGKLFDDTSFRVYSSQDIVGVATAGALKNVIAIAAGISAGLELGHNASAALITRGLGEIMRLVVALGGQKETLMGLAGLGDLVLTCTSELSRNYRLGLGLASGRSLVDAQRVIGQVTEGVRTAESAVNIAQRFSEEVPIMQAVHDVIHCKISAQDAVVQLMQRPERIEFAC